MIIFIYGQDTYRSSQRVAFLRAAFCQKFDKKGFNTKTLFGEDLKIEDFRQAILSQGLLSQKRFVVVRNLILLKKPADFYRAVLEEVKRLGNIEDVILIFWETADLAGKKRGNLLYDFLIKKAKKEEFSLLVGSALQKWILEEVKKNGGEISLPAVQYLAANISSDLWTQKSEIDKLVAYKNKKKIELADTEQFVSLAVNDNIFNFTDALANKNVKLAAKLFEDQLVSGANEFYLLTMLARQFRILLEINQALEKGLSSGEMQRDLKLHPFVIKKSLSQARKFSFFQLKNIYRKLLEIDNKLKTSALPPKALFDLFIVEVCQ